MKMCVWIEGLIGADAGNFERNYRVLFDCINCF